MRSQGGTGDVRRTLQVCRVLVHDQDAMVTKALSWALRELVIHDADAVQTFLEQYDAVLAALVKREVKNKLRTGLKNPRGKSHSSEGRRSLPNARHEPTKLQDSVRVRSEQ
jgi:DNA alkylation repair enzyme